MTAPLLALALAAAPEILLPPWPLSPDGDLVAVPGDAAPAVEGGSAERVAPRLWRVVPAPGAARVTVRAGGAEASAPVAPPPGEVRIAVKNPAPVKGRDEAVEIAFAVVGADGGPDADAPAPLVSVSSGRLRDLAPDGPGRFRAVYELAPTRYPEVAVLLAFVPRCPLCPTPRAVGHAIVPVSAAVDLRGESERGTRTTVDVAGRTFGPVAADAKGKFKVPVVVPPGAHTGAATTVDAVGNAKATTLDLHLPEVDRLACAAWPRAVPADGRAEVSVYCVASTATGLPARDARLLLSASLGTIGALAPDQPGSPLQRARWRAPAGGGGADTLLRAAYPGGGAASRDEVRVALATGAPAEIAARVREPVEVGTTVPAETAVRDAQGDVVGRPAAPAGAKVGFVAPDRFVAAPSGTSQEAGLAFALAPGSEVATLTLRPEPAGWLAEARTVDARPAAGVRLAFGDGTEATTDARGEARAPASGPRGSVTARSGARAAGFAAAPPPPVPFEISRTVRIALRPPAPVDVLASVEGGVLRWRVAAADGHPLAGRRVVLRSDGVELGPPERDGDGGRAAVVRGRGLVAVEDAETGVAAVVEVP